MNLQQLYELIRDNIYFYDKNNIKHLYNIIKKYNGDDWKEYRIVNCETYNKIYINGNDDFELYIITWNKNQESKIHNHSNNCCVYKILEGHLSEEEYDNKLKLLGFKSLYKDCIGYIDDYFQLHKMINHTDNVAVSLHIYSPPNHQTKYYDDPPD